MDSHDPLERTQQESGSPSAAQLLTQSAPQTWWSTLIGAVVSLAAMFQIFSAWKAGLIPNWKYAMGALLIAALPAGVTRDLGAMVLRRLPYLNKTNGK